MTRLTRPFDQAEYNYMLRSIEAIYDKFTTIVAEGRNLEKKRVDEIGQGRVWAGTDALQIGLVDEIGPWKMPSAMLLHPSAQASSACWSIRSLSPPWKA